MNLVLKTFICNKRKCLKRISIFKNSFFQTCKIKINKLLMLCYLYLLKTPVDGIKKATGLSSATITDWTHYLRQLLGEAVDEEQTVIGGPGIIVEIDETKMGKRKYNRGRRAEGVWVIAGIERTTEKKIFVLKSQKETKIILHKSYQNILEKVQ
ncbi:hypothetical protein H312_01007 [Anncaliia algerae PRA339]|uniref:ISXO2-like transposase domain-containing protein n=1 Tax=Anncaliia algerae PRA339 TaxID=1288291 RepID=A0A059F3L3_9MICR|nr:hypothetical protein H312_01007 [Anncaliia algerae PRA339]